MTPQVLTAVVFGAAGALVGASVVPAAADAALRRAFSRSRRWWWDSLDGFRAFRELNPGSVPSSAERGEAGAIGIWVQDSVAAARAGTLPAERLDALRGAGVDPGEVPKPLRSESDQERRCSMRASPPIRAVCAFFMALSFAALGASGAAGLLALLCGACLVAMAAGVVCDMKARMIPIECCAALALVGAALQFHASGIAAVAFGCVAAIVVVAACALANRFLAKGGAWAIGGGDVRCMAALCLASGAACPVGLAACYGAAALYSLAGMALGKLRPRDGVPMAPFLALWLVAGIIAIAM